MNADALQVALDELRSTGDLGPLYDVLRATGWRSPTEYSPMQQLILDNIEEDPETGCWLWTGNQDKDGYGLAHGKRAHRVSYEAFVGPIPGRMHVDHVCRRRSCVRPDPKHLEPVTLAENDRRARAYVQKYPGERVHNGAKRWCKHGHKYTPENTGLDKLGKRFCRACQRDFQRRRKKRIRETQPATKTWHVRAERWLEARDNLVPNLDGPTLLTSEVAALWGITHKAFSDWKRRNPGLLRPVSGGGVGVALLWSKTEVEAIMKFRTGYANSHPSGEGTNGC